MRATPLLVGIIIGLAGCIAMACTTDYQQGKDDVAYGGPNALEGKQPPGTSIDVGANNEAGASSGGTVTCGMQIDGGTCAVTFSGDIMTAWTAANCSLVSCHGGATPVNQPPIDTMNAKTTWNTLQAFTISSGLPYINPCSTDPTASAVAANMLADPGAKGGSHMPQSSQLPQADIDKINTWVACGAPNN